jgi:hypothetical protein
LLSHRFERARELYADQWLGFSEVQLHQWLEEAGFGKPTVSLIEETVGGQDGRVVSKHFCIWNRAR